MGLLDAFQGLGNMSPDQTQGLLAAAAQMLQQSGPSRTPTSFGQILGGGLGAYQQGTDAARRRKQDELQAAQIAKLTGLKIQDAESDFANQAAARDRAEQLRQFYMKQGGAGLPPAPGGAGTLPAASMDGGEFHRAAESYGLPTDNDSLNKVVGLVNGGMTPAQAASSLAGKSSPTLANSQFMQAAGGRAAPTQGGASGGNQKQGIYEQRLTLAQQLRNAGFSQEADAQEAAALKFQPQVDSWESVRVDGKIYKKPYYKDGTSGDFIPAELAEKLMKVDTGGKTLLAGEMSGNTYQTLTNTADPNTIANNNVAMRSQNISRQNALDALATPTYNQEAGGFITRPSAASPGGAFTPLTGSAMRAPKMTEDQGKATGWLVQAENAYANLKAVGLDKAGKPTDAARPGLPDAIGAIPGLGPVANKLRGAERQKFIQATSSLSESLLRAATGAGVNREEAAQKVQELTPIYGEDPSVTKQKFDAIPLYIEGLKVRAGPGAGLAEKVLSKRPPAPSKDGWSIQRVED